MNGMTSELIYKQTRTVAMVPLSVRLNSLSRKYQFETMCTVLQLECALRTSRSSKRIKKLQLARPAGRC